MSISNATMVDLISSILQDESNALFKDPAIQRGITSGLLELAKMHPHKYEAEFKLESRRGTADTDTANALVDTAEAQFLAGDVDKTVYNPDDRTWAKVTAFVSTSQLTLSADIFPDGDENYRIYNEGTTSDKEFSLKSPQQPSGVLGTRVLDYLYIDKIEYPILQDPPLYINWEEQDNGIVRLKVDRDPDDTQQETAKDEVRVTFALRHNLSQLTDWLGAVDLSAGYAAGSTSMVIDGLQSSGTLFKGQQFVIDGIRGTYIADADVTIATNEATVTFWPPLLAAASEDDVVRFTMSTLKEAHETPFADMVAGKLAMDISASFIGKINFAGATPNRDWYAWGVRKYNAAIDELGDQRGNTFAMVDLP